MFSRSYNHKDVLTRASMTIQIIDDIALYKAQLFSTNGNILSTSEKDTNVSLAIFKGIEDITSKFTDIVWSRFSSKEGAYEEDKKWGEQHKNKTSITITRDDITEKANIQAAVYDIVDGERKVVAADFISFIDINDLKGSQYPPENPKDGDLWLNTSVIPPRIMIWNAALGQWIELEVAGSERRNLIRNSNFYTSDFQHWGSINSPNLTIEKMEGKKWARIRSDIINNDKCGLRQVIDAKPLAKYAFQMLSEIYIQSANPNGNTVVIFNSINDKDEKTLIQKNIFDIDTDIRTYITTFTSLKNTRYIEVIISGQEDATFDFVVTNLKLENNAIATVWEIAIEDMEDALNTKVGNTHEEVFESLTDNGKMQGIYVDTDEHGQKNYYFNASYIKSGQIIGEYINAKNLTVTRKDGIETLKIDNNGNVTIRGKIKLQGIDDSFDDAASVDDISYKVEIISTNGTVFSNGQIQTELIARVFKGKNDITDSLNNNRFQWTKIFSDGTVDEDWTNSHGKATKTILITKNDVYQRCTFSCSVLSDKEYLKIKGGR